MYIITSIAAHLGQQKGQKKRRDGMTLERVLAVLPKDKITRRK